MEHDARDREQERSNSAKDETGGRGYWFASQLGDEWQPDGAGIYRYVGRAEEDQPADEEVAAAADRSLAISEELSEALDPARRDESSDGKKSGKKAKRARLLRRRDS
jgi:hypothetical protein